MNPDFTSDRHAEPLPGAWRSKATSARADPTDYYATAESSYSFRNAHSDFEGYKKPEPETFDRPFDRFNGNQPVFPPMEDRQGLMGGEGGSRKRLMHESSGGAYYQSKIPRSHDARSAAPIPNYRFAGDSYDILQEESRKCIAEMSQELAMLENPQVPEFQYLAHTRRLLNEEINKITTSTNAEWLDVESNKSSVKILKRVLLPRTRPGCNVVGRLMGVGGSTLRKMCQTYKCHISICGAGSRKNPKEETELLRSGDSRHNHLACPLHAEVSTTGPPYMAYTRLGQILTLLNKIITVEERFEHDGLVFETSNTEQYHQRRGDKDGDGEYKKDNGAGDYREDRSYRGRGLRGRGPPRQNYRNESSSQQHNTSWRTNEQGEPEKHKKESPKAAEGTPGRGRGRGGFVPRGGRGGFVPRRSDQ